MDVIKNSNSIFKKGFTLAEVLITLVIIGVIASMTIPTAISKYRKKVVETKLKATYSIIANMFKMAEANYGSISSWNLENNYGSSNAADMKEAFVKKYMLPFLNSNGYEKKTWEEFGYKNDILYPDGSVANSKTATTSGLMLGNGTFLQVAVSYLSYNNNTYYLSFAFRVDVDGPNKGQNTIAKDIFYFQKTFNDYPLLVMGEYGTTVVPATTNNVAGAGVVFNVNTGQFIFQRKATREEVMSQCREGDSKSAGCGALILYDGWKVSDDYPWL